MESTRYRPCFSSFFVLAHRYCAVLLLPLIVTVSQPSLGQDLNEETVERAKKATVMVWTFASKKKKADTALGTGTGYFINSTGLLMTNNHVIDPAHGMSLRDRQNFQYKTNRLTFRVIENSGTDDEKRWDCDLIHQSVTADQALLQARDEEGDLLDTPYFLELLPSWRLDEQLSVCALGFPGGNRQAEKGRNAKVSVSHGKITKVPRSTSGRVRRIETDAVARPGNSGGPMIDGEGAVVGTVTLMGQAKEQANQCSLVPASLTRSFLRDAMKEGRLAQGTDVVPFLDIMAQSSGPLDIPAFKRMPDRDIVFMAEDERIYGTFSDQTSKLALPVIKWESPLGRFEVPVKSVAYVLRYGDRLDLVFENGDHLAATDTRGKFCFSVEGGSVVHKPFRRISALAFRTHSTPKSRTRGDAVVLSSDAGRLVLTGVKGKAKLKSRSGEIDLPLTSISRIELDVDGRRQVVSLTDDRVIKGRIGAQKYRATMAGLANEIELELSKVSHARIELVDGSVFDSQGVTLFDILRSADPELIDVAKTLDTDDFAAARTKLTPYLEKDRMKRMPDGLKAQVRLLDGVIAIRAGDTDAAKKIRKCIKAKDPNVAAYARGSVEVLKRFGDKYDGRSLSDPDAFADAGLALGNELIQTARALLKDRDLLKGKRGEYTKYLTKIKKSEKAMQAASVFAGPEADDVLMNLWKMTLDLCKLESRRLIREYDSVAAGRNKVPQAVYQKLHTIGKKHRRLVVEWADRYTKLRDYGFYHAEAPEKRKLDK